MTGVFLVKVCQYHVWDILSDLISSVTACPQTNDRFYLLGEGWRSIRMWLCPPKGWIRPKREGNFFSFMDEVNSLMFIWVKDGKQ